MNINDLPQNSWQPVNQPVNQTAPVLNINNLPKDSYTPVNSQQSQGTFLHPLDALSNQYNNAVSTAKEGVTSGASQMQQGGVGNVVGGIAKAGLGTASAGVQSVFAPFSASADAIIPQGNSELGKFASDTVKGAVVGSELGTVVPGAGTVAGGVIGGLFGAGLHVVNAVKDAIFSHTNISEPDKAMINNALNVGLAVIGEKVGNAKTQGEGLNTPVTDITASTMKANLPNIPNPIDAIGNKLDTVLSPLGNLTDIQPTVDASVKTSLNPFKSLGGTGQDINVSIKNPDGSLSLKPLSTLTDAEKANVQSSTAQTMDEFNKQAEAFKLNREAPGGSPLEIVGMRADKALAVADAQRKQIGKQMGEIEQQYTDTPLDISTDVYKKFSDTLNELKTKYASNNGGSIVEKLTNDFDTLQKSGATIGERLQFVRDWQADIAEAKDGFGNFKENGRVYSQIQKAVNSIRDETVNHISDTDKNYAQLRKQYGEYIKLSDEGDRLMGKDGLLGQPIKGAATIKRAIQSNSDAGARQFLTVLKNTTGYDAMKEGDLAITAMDNAGDYQQLNLLNVADRIPRSVGDVIPKVLEFIKEKIGGSERDRVEKYINDLSNTP